MLRAILIDDEPLCTEGLEVDIKAVADNIEIIAKCNSAKEGLQAIKKLKPDVVFLDIEMPWLNGFELIELLMPIDFKLIFITAYNEYALKAFRVHAIDYLMKPVDRNLLDIAIKRLNDTSSSKNDNIKELIDAVSTKSKNRIALPNSDGLDIIDVNEIMYCKAQGNYSDVHLVSETKSLVCRVLKEIENQLSDSDFLRVHQSYLVNMDFVSSYHRSDGGYIILTNGEQLPVSRSNKSVIYDRLKKL